MVQNDKENFESKDAFQRLIHDGVNLSLSWSNLSVFVKTTKNSFCRNVTTMKQIIHNGSGIVRTGQIVGLMGPSSSGKTTLLTALAHRYQGDTIVEGEIKLNGNTVDKSVRHVSGFMFQDDFFLKVLTVREHLMFSARLKMGKNTSNEERKARVEALLDALLLRKVANYRIGGLAQQGEKPLAAKIAHSIVCEILGTLDLLNQALLSGGEKRRLSLATAMINHPLMLFADEPTTGLDSYNAHQIVNLLKSVSQTTGMPVLCSIHQPMPETFALFNKIILLAEGHLMFSGTPGNAVQFYKSCGFEENKFMSHGEFIVNCVSPIQGYQIESRQKLQILSDEFFNSKYYDLFKEEINTPNVHEKSDICSTSFYDQCWIKKLWLLIWRNLIVEFRTPERQWLTVLQKIILATVCGLCFSTISNEDQDGIQGVQGVIYLLITENTYAPMYSIMYLFVKDYPQFVTEYYNNTYSESAYYIAKVISIIPGYIFESLAFTLILYKMANLRQTLYAILMTQLFAFLCIIISSAFGISFSNIFISVPTAITYMVPIDYIMMITAGIFINLGSLNEAVQWLKYCSWFYYIYESYTILQWQGIEKISCSTNHTEIPCLSSGDQVIAHYNFSPDNLVKNVYALTAMFLIIHGIGLLFFIRKVRKM